MATATYTFGIATPTGSLENWLIQSVSHNHTAQEALALNAQGEPVDAHYYQKTEELTLEAIIPDGATPPTVGGTFALDGTVYYCTGFTHTESNTDYNKYSINCKRFVTTGLPEESSSGA